MPRFLIGFATALFLGCPALLAADNILEELEWVVLSPDSLLQTAFHLKIKRAGKARTATVSFETEVGREKIKRERNLEEPNVSDLLEILKVQQLRDWKPAPSSKCGRSVRWDLVREGKITPLCGRSPDAQKISELTQAIQVLFHP